MKKGSILIIVLAIIAILVFWGIGVYNGLVTAEEKVNKQWSNVESQYQRRYDLIDNLVNTVKGYASHESQTLENVVAARSKATQVTVDPEKLTEEKMREFQEAQGELGNALGRLLMITENYPDLKANQNFLELQSQIEGTENRIQTERSRYNEEAQEYNTSVRKFPKAMIASMFGFAQKPYFAADQEASKAPKVQF